MVKKQVKKTVQMKEPAAEIMDSDEYLEEELAELVLPIITRNYELVTKCYKL